jgi:hypothetical protein
MLFLHAPNEKHLSKRSREFSWHRDRRTWSLAIAIIAELIPAQSSEGIEQLGKMIRIA